MFRRWAIAGGLVCGGVAVAQPWPAVPADRPSAEAVYVMRTAGQNERQVKVVRAADPSDPASMAEVKDVATGDTFVIPGKVLAKLPKAGGKRAEAVSPPPTAETAPRPTAVAPPVETKTVLPPVETKTVLPPVETTPVTPTRVPVAEPIVRVERVEAGEVQAPTPSRIVTPTGNGLPVVPSPVTSNTPLTTVTPANVTAPPRKPTESNDPWRGTGEVRAVPPTPPPPAAGPRLTAVPTWRPTASPAIPGVTDPWRPTGG